MVAGSGSTWVSRGLGFSSFPAVGRTSGVWAIKEIELFVPTVEDPDENVELQESMLYYGVHLPRPRRTPATQERAEKALRACLTRLLIRQVVDDLVAI